MKIFLGPGGIPHSAKGSTTIGGIRKVAELGLNAMEIEFVRSIYIKESSAKQIGDVAKESGVRLSIHAPYYVNLCSKDEETVTASKDRIIKSIEIGDILGADNVAVHAAYYTGLAPEKAYDVIKERVIEILDELKSKGVHDTKFGLETMGRSTQFGSLDEIISMCRDINHEQLVPYLDWGHLFVRNKGKIDYVETFDKLNILKLDHINSQFEGIDKNKKGEFVDVHTSVGEYPPFEPLAREILKRKIDITIISESPLLELDSLKMKNTFEKLKHPI